MKNKGVMAHAACVLTLLITAILLFLIVYGPELSYADGYKYRITIHAGNMGTLNGKTVWTAEYDEGEEVYISLDSVGFKLNDDRYYARGFVVSGHDNDETTGSQSMTFSVDRDMEYTVAYGIKGSMVKYVVHYVDPDGNDLLDPDAFYGMPGDKPVVSYRYIDGWQPESYNIAGTLSENEDENVFRFRYSKAGNDNENGNNNDNGGNGADQAGNGQNVNPAAPGTNANPAGTNVNRNQDNGRNIDDTPVPRAGGDNKKQYTDIDNKKTPKSSPMQNWSTLIWVIAVLLILLMLIIMFILKKKKSDEKHDEDLEE